MAEFRSKCRALAVGLLLAWLGVAHSPAEAATCTIVGGAGAIILPPRTSSCSECQELCDQHPTRVYRTCTWDSQALRAPPASSYCDIRSSEGKQLTAPFYGKQEDCDIACAAFAETNPNRVCKYNEPSAPARNVTPCGATIPPSSDTVMVTRTETSTGTSTNVESSVTSSTLGSESLADSRVGMNASSSPASQASALCQAAAASALGALGSLQEGDSARALVSTQEMTAQLDRAGRLDSDCAPGEAGEGFLDRGSIAGLAGNVKESLGVGAGELLASVHALAAEKKWSAGQSPAATLGELVGAVPDAEAEARLRRSLAGKDIAGEFGQKPEPVPRAAPVPEAVVARPAQFPVSSEPAPAAREPAASKAMPTQPVVNTKLAESESERAEIKELQRIMAMHAAERGGEHQRIMQEKLDTSLFVKVKRCYGRYATKLRVLKPAAKP